MSNKMPPIGGLELVKILKSQGFSSKRQRGGGSHIIVWKEGETLQFAVPDHKEIKKKTLHSILKDAGMTLKELAELRQKKK